jgi:hypothetical protein
MLAAQPALQLFAVPAGHCRQFQHTEWMVISSQTTAYSFKWLTIQRLAVLLASCWLNTNFQTHQALAVWCEPPNMRVWRLPFYHLYDNSLSYNGSCYCC